MEPEAVQELEEQEDEQRRKLLETLEEMESLVEALGGDAELIDAAASFPEAVE